MWNDVITLELFFCVALRQLPIVAQAGLDIMLCVVQASLELNYVAQNYLEYSILLRLSPKDWDY